MIRRIYSIHDKISQDFSPVFEAKNDQVAVRQFNNWHVQMAEKDATFDINDYLLFRIGKMNDTYPCTLESDFECLSLQENEECEE